MKCISWSAVLVGALVGVGLSFLLNLFSVAIGLSVFTSNTEGLVSLAIGGFIGLIIGGIVSMFLAGFAAGYLGRTHCWKHNLGIIYGFTTWSLALIITVLLTSHVGRYVAAYSNFIANPATIIVTSNENAPIVSESPNNSNAVTVNAEKATRTIGLGAFVVFILFLIGAISCCVGAYWGMSCRDDDDVHVRV
ncbi:MAG: hypothetical protein H0W64_08840 [Gammaproteobacteria bacterium]|nr:hypothetical protein [Gammaproteobacteria bacterium]